MYFYNYQKGDKLFNGIYTVMSDAIEGGMSKVWKVYNNEWNSDIALKIPVFNFLGYDNYKTILRENFINECKLWINMGLHPYIVTCYYVTELDGEIASFSEWQDGGNLYDMIKSGKLYKGTKDEQFKRILKIAEQIIIGIEFAHSNNVIHKDIKPQNIVFSECENIKITDFGMSNAKSIGFSLPYSSPEQKKGENVGYETDIFSWAVTVVEMLVKDHSWKNSIYLCDDDYLENILSKSEFKISPVFKELLSRCLSNNPKSRMLLEDIKNIIGGMYAVLSTENACDFDINFETAQYMLKTISLYDGESEGYSFEKVSEIYKSLFLSWKNNPFYCFTTLSDDAGTLNNTALSYLVLGDEKGAIQCWKDALEKCPNHPESNYNYNTYLWSTGKITNKMIEYIFEYILPANDEFYQNEFKKIFNNKKIRCFYTSNDELVPKNYEYCDMEIQSYFSNDQKNVISNITFQQEFDSKRAIAVWNIENGELINKYVDDEIDEILISKATDIQISSDGRFSKNGGLYTNDESKRCYYSCDDDEEILFSPDGQSYLICGKNTLPVLFSLPDTNVKFTPRLSKVVSVDELIKLNEKYKSLLKKFQNTEIVKDKIDILNQMSEILHFGNTVEFLMLQKSFSENYADYCQLVNPKVIRVEYFEKDLQSVEFSCDGKFFAIAHAENGKSYSVSLFFNENSEKADEFTFPHNEEMFDLEYFWGIDEIWDIHFSLDSKKLYIVIDNEYQGGLNVYCIDINDNGFVYKDGYLQIEYIDFNYFQQNILIKNHKIRDDVLEICNIHSVCDISTDGRKLITGGNRGTVIYSITYSLQYISKESSGESEEQFLDDINILETYEEKEIDKLENTLITGINENNKFLLEFLDSNEINFLENLSKKMIEIPSIKFNNLSKMALNYLQNNSDNGVQPVVCDTLEEYISMENKNGFVPPHYYKNVQNIMSMSDEEYYDLLDEINRKSRYWNKKEQMSFLELFLISQETIKKTDENIESNENNEITKFLRSSKEIRRTEYLPRLEKSIYEMKKILLDSVKGQEYAVESFAKGIFNAEVMANADSKRKRPKAIFTFAGPPGVGKTFLAEKAAEYLKEHGFIDAIARFDMTEYSGNNAHEGLIGFDFTWKNSSPGKLTEFVMRNPRSIIVFDEIEKSHPKVIQLFYQILDAGVITDNYIKTAKIAINNGNSQFTDKDKNRILNTPDKISFKDIIIIFTTNAGHSLYESSLHAPGSEVPVQTILNALRNDINPITKERYFPEAIVSRISTGYPILFNHLSSEDLVSIVKMEYEKNKKLFKEYYDVELCADDEKLFLALLFSQGGKPDARRLQAQTKLFFENEIRKTFTLMRENLSEILPVLKRIRFVTEIFNADDKVRELFISERKSTILLYSDPIVSMKWEKNLSDIAEIYSTQNIDEALNLVAEKDIDFAVVDIMHEVFSNDYDDTRTVLASMNASIWESGRKLFVGMRKKFAEIPIYLLEKNDMKIDERLVSDFINAGAAGKIKAYTSPDDLTKLRETVSSIGTFTYMKNMAENISVQHKVLSFETAPKKSNDNEEIIISLRNFELKRVIETGDAESLLSDAEIPNIRFENIIGAKEAKETLTSFVNYFKNPKQYIAKGFSLPKGVILYGRPGTGKTMLAKAMAGECGVTFLPIVASMFTDGKSQGPDGIKGLFDKARRYAPSIIFIDEVDTIAKQRTGDNTFIESLLNAFLSEMDGFSTDPKRPVFVLAATNYDIEEENNGIGVLDEAFMRRFDRKILVTLPDKDDRLKFINLNLKKIKKHNISENCINNISARSTGMSLATLQHIINTAKQIAFDNAKELDDLIILEAFEKIRYGEKKDCSEEFIESIACHESGHSIMYYLSGLIPEYLTIEGRSNFGGYMEFSEEEKNKYIKTKNDIINNIKICLGGRAAEIVYYGREKGINTGFSADLKMATNNAINMISYYGMDEDFGIMSMSFDNAVESDSVRKRVNEILKREMEITINCISERKYILDTLVASLIKKNKLTKTQIACLIKASELKKEMLSENEIDEIISKENNFINN